MMDRESKEKYEEEKNELKNEHQQLYVTFDMIERAHSTIPLAFGSAYSLIGGSRGHE